ncbi:hypothetical protein AKJ63_00630 [candidate division MSBL1 archaeon SCGC-AAA259D18]|uniref:Uncharacterized protein n=2 Tax=candidate division MSBL1 TaxID=215777 RepID=A0A133UBL5_9EURY|nr:hypothetical protein AKJ57_00710 [candidate division MSBL1 archaeon SCGC-AAA259A05]KXA91846.1 hypothetical protein AKJ63_00630 [candidate division MSBL1 archaeon SCGC-AAA259D18]
MEMMREDGKRGKISIWIAVLAVLAAIVGGVIIIGMTEEGNTSGSGNGNGPNTAPATLDILLWNDSNTRTVKFSVFVDENMIWKKDLTRKPRVTPSGLESFKIGLEKGKHTVKAMVQNGETKTERQKIEIRDENYWIAVSYTQENRIQFHESDDNPIVVQ